ncbi:ABC transporter substrate-binding protein [Alcaligenes nematophilus]|uniref:ABC transporter substrate-binding protein n=1 Tax=Alcaligenes nematophilus TaxID=2994643 RepID=UPI0034E0D808
MSSRALTHYLVSCMLLVASTCVAAANSPEPPIQKGGVLHLALLGLDTADPHRHSGSIAVQQVFVETLTSIADDGQVKPFLAEHYTVSDDGKNYSFTLRQGVRFHNGRLLQASDIVANIDRVKEKIKGGWLSGAMKLITSVQAPDERTVQIVLREPYAPFLNLLSELWIVAPESEGWSDTISKPIGTGPFMFGAWTPNMQFSAPRFDQYWQEGLPYLDSLVFDLQGNKDNSLGLRAGDLQVAYVAADRLPSLRKSNFEIQTLKDSAWYFLSFNNRKPSALMSQPLVREAIAAAIDKAAYMKFIAGDAAVISNQAMKPGTYYWDFELEKADTTALPNLAKAQQLLEQAGVNPKEHTLKVVSWQNEYAQVAVQMVRQLGFKVDHQALDDIGAQKLLSDYQWDLAPFHSGPRADVYLRYARLLSDGPSPMLWGGIQDAQLDALIEQAVSSPSAEKARQHYLQAWKHVLDKQYTVPIGHAADAIALAPQVKGYQTGYTWSQNRVDGGVARVWLAKE